MYDIYISRPFKNMYLNCMGSLIWDFSSVNLLEKLLAICNSLKKLADKYKSLEILIKIRKVSYDINAYNRHVNR